jgi:hypothetical protein
MVSCNPWQSQPKIRMSVEPKLADYFTLPSLHHYLIVDPERVRAVHFRRGTGEALETRIVREGTIRLDPPGFEVALARFSSGEFYSIPSSSAIIRSISDSPPDQNAGSRASSPNGAKSSAWCFVPPAESMAK